MKKLCLAFALALTAAAPAWAASATAVLRPSAVVDGSVVTLGDIFANVGDKAATPVAHAPEPGRRMVLDARWLAGIAGAYGLGWSPLSLSDRVVVERRSVVVGADRIAEALLPELAALGAPADAEVQIGNRSLQLHLPADAPAEVAVRDVEYDARTRRFLATVEAGDPARPVVARVSGRVYDTARVPVLVRPVQRGEVIGADDLEWREVRLDIVQRGILTEAEQVVGQEARMALRPGQPLKSSDVRRPVVVAKGSMVTMVLRHGSLMLTAQGKAVDNGAAGDVIRVSNTASRAIVEAKVEGPSLVSVTPIDRVLAN